MNEKRKYKRVHELNSTKNYQLENNISIITDVISEIGLVEEHNPDSIVRQESFSSIFIKYNNDEYAEIWGCYYKKPCDNHLIYKLL